MHNIMTEGKAKIKIAVSTKITRKMPVFYNPEMKLNRDISVLLLKSLKTNHLKIADPLAASGVRSIRFLTELNNSKISQVFINDASKVAVKNIKNNLKLNKLNGNKKIFVKKEEASIFLLKNKPFDYIDIDPFGTPVNFLDSAVKSLSRKGILAVTATDTAALSGTAPKACLRKYWADPLKNFLMHEFGLRIFIRRVQLAAASNDKALTPIYAYSKLHYMRVFFTCSWTAKDIDKVLKQHNFISYCNNCLTAEVITTFTNSNCDKCQNKKTAIAGPMWTQNLFDKKLATDIYKNNTDEGNNNFLKIISNEAKINSLGFYDTHVFSERLKITAPKLESVVSALKKQNFEASRTHLSGTGIRTNASYSAFAKLMKKL